MFMKQIIEKLDWNNIGNLMNDTGYALVDHLLSDEQCDSLVEQYDDPV